jgi:hypothetical protein
MRARTAPARLMNLRGIMVMLIFQCCLRTRREGGLIDAQVRPPARTENWLGVSLELLPQDEACSPFC